jgi:hypothetical protein
VLGTNCEHSMVETLWVIHKSLAVMLERSYIQFLSGPTDNPASNYKFGSRSEWINHHISPSTGCYMHSRKKSQQILKNNNLRKKNLKTTYHKVLSSTIHELVNPFLVIINSHVCFHKKLHQAWFASKNYNLQTKIIVS